MMDSKTENEVSHNLEQRFHQDATYYAVNYSHGRKTNEMQAFPDKTEDFTKKRYPVNRSGNNTGRVKRVVSCKRKSHHPLARRKQPGKTFFPSNNDGQQEPLVLDSLEFPVNTINRRRTGDTGLDQDECSLFSELSQDHGTMMEVLSGRSLRLKVSSTLWHRNVGELLAYFLRIPDTSVFVDFLPQLTKSIHEMSPRITIGCCVDLFPLVQKILTSPYEEYLLVGLKWINSVLIRWSEELKTSGSSQSTTGPVDINFQVFNQQLSDFWHQEPSLKYLPGPAGDLAKVIDSFLPGVQWRSG
ncbi:KATNB1-like protein 1 isoform X1 [Takifugu rubripes]|uniref:KATNB1-like protein 1 isoform X1 n=1 Tax=Takifugu rubripes TaxID=31033 RepID=UPI00114609C5|nr:KATNB1-like protein 1 isoform X1 [Takifugu rubripes]XP_029688510.1 KATNB1-like protein 1 isoform X1 [Takifugu rubripes]XP_029688511.1 KATNB1-like protein 1 isoform X1 [Takifugu rubripes]